MLPRGRRMHPEILSASPQLVTSTLVQERSGVHDPELAFNHYSLLLQYPTHQYTHGLAALHEHSNCTRIVGMRNCVWHGVALLNKGPIGLDTHRYRRHH